MAVGHELTRPLGLLRRRQESHRTRRVHDEVIECSRARILGERPLITRRSTSPPAADVIDGCRTLPEAQPAPRARAPNALMDWYVERRVAASGALI